MDFFLPEPTRLEAQCQNIKLKIEREEKFEHICGLQKDTTPTWVD